MKKLKIYLDTSVISHYFAEDTPEKMAITRVFFDQKLKSDIYETYISYLVLQELGQTKSPELRNKLLNFAHDLSATILQLTPGVEEVTRLFLDQKIIPPKVENDAIHLALALVNRMDYIISWNFVHMVKPKTREAVLEFALKEGYKNAAITTPEEVIKGE